MPAPVMTVDAAKDAFSVAFFLGLGVVAQWETLAPRRAASTASAHQRWFGNLGLFAMDMMVVHAAFPMLCVAAAYHAADRGWGLFGAIDAPSWLAFLVTFLAMDLGRYMSHRSFHAVPLFWRFHAVHHADPDVDVSTGLRFHPFEAILTTTVNLTVVVALGGPPEAVVLSEVVSAIVSLWSHGKVGVPEGIDRWLRLVLVTPDLHRTHHSIVRAEADSNYGNSLILWDRLLGTYVAAPAAGHESMVAGYAGFSEPGCLRLDRLLLRPFAVGASSRVDAQDGVVPASST